MHLELREEIEKTLVEFHKPKRGFQATIWFIMITQSYYNLTGSEDHETFSGHYIKKGKSIFSHIRDSAAHNKILLDLLVKDIKNRNF